MDISSNLNSEIENGTAVPDNNEVLVQTDR